MTKLEEFLKYSNIIEGEINYLTDSEGVRTIRLSRLIEIIRIQNEAINDAHNHVCGCCDSDGSMKYMAEEVQEKINKLLEG